MFIMHFCSNQIFFFCFFFQHCCFCCCFCFVDLPCCLVVLPCCIHCHALLSHLIVLAFALCYSHSYTLLLSLSCPTTFVFTPCYSHLLLAPCYSCPHTLLLLLLRLATHALLFLLLHLAILFQVPPTPPQLLFHCLTTRYCTLMFYLVNWYSLPTLLCRWRNLDQHHQASSNNKGFYFLDFLSFFSQLCILFVIYFLN